MATCYSLWHHTTSAASALLRDGRARATPTAESGAQHIRLPAELPACREVIPKHSREVPAVLHGAAPNATCGRLRHAACAADRQEPRNPASLAQPLSFIRSELHSRLEQGRGQHAPPQGYNRLLDLCMHHRTSSASSMVAYRPAHKDSRVSGH